MADKNDDAECAEEKNRLFIFGYLSAHNAHNDIEASFSFFSFFIFQLNMG